MATALVNAKAVSGQNTLYAWAVIDQNKGELINKVLNEYKTGKIPTISISVTSKTLSQAPVFILQSNELAKVNSFEKKL